MKPETAEKALDVLDAVDAEVFPVVSSLVTLTTIGRVLIDCARSLDRIAEALEKISAVHREDGVEGAN